ncbi:MAG: hypothetical protein HC820_05335 [Hydrococcus sp. RM1_1_31]|nr:hypothetical protein [Hydrococcus sp. RM1_1_31]
MEILNSDLEQLVTAVEQWQIQSHSLQSIDFLVEEIQSLTSSTEISESEKSELQDSLTAIAQILERLRSDGHNERLEGVDKLAEAVNALHDEEALANSDLETNYNF